VICKIQDQSSHPPAEDGIVYNNIESSEPIGVLLIYEVPSELRHHRSVTFGIEIKPGQQGYGYGTETVRWALDWAFKTAGLHRVQLQVYEWNQRVRKIYESVGFKIEGRLRQALWSDGQWWDEIIMGILDNEWGVLKYAHVEKTVKE
jgi:RimJ/RimL family protein N-acetyltransferase